MSITRGIVTRAWSLVVASSLLSPAIVGCASNGDTVDPASPKRLRVLLDYSPTLSDAGALLYLASNPAVDLLAVTLPGTGEADCEPGTRTTRALLAVADRIDVPVGCGRNTPLIGDRDWPEEWRSEVNDWGTEMLPAVEPEPVRDAEQLLTDTLVAATTPITLVTVGPLTNLGVVLAAHPELAGQIERIVIMGGAVTVPGNVEASPAAEWNIYIDPESARRVLASGVPVTFVPLDATNHLPWTERLLRRLATLDGPAARTVHQMATSRPTLAGFYLWDELAAMTAVNPDLVISQTMTVRIDDNGAIVRDPDGVAVAVAVNADADAAAQEFLRMLNGGTLPDVVPLTPAELDYMVTLAGIDSRSNATLAHAYDTVSRAEGDPHAVAAAFVAEVFAAIAALVADLERLEPPPSLGEAHADYVKLLTQFVASKEDLLAAVAEADGTDFDELMADATTRASLGDIFEQARHACQVLEDYSFLHDGPRPCSSAAQQ
ncbi:MAG: nucleoside hydrolase [Actinomycetota bacterium]|nr:nucleoside hydrolase [Actinomycetota bacterium]